MLSSKIRSRQLKRSAFIGALLIIGHFLGLWRPLENLFFRAWSGTTTGFYNLAGNWRTKAATDNTLTPEAQIASLKQQVADLTLAAADREALLSENQKLRDFLNFFNTEKRNYKLAKVVAQENFLDSSQTGQDLIINKGSRDGLLPGLALINGAGLLAGKVLEVYDNSARVCLITNNDCKFAITILNQNRTIGISEGDLGLTVKLNFVGQTEKLDVGNIIVTSGLEKDVPAGLVVGRVTQKSNPENDVWQKISVEPLVNLQNLGVVAVLLPN